MGSIASALLLATGRSVGASERDPERPSAQSDPEVAPLADALGPLAASYGVLMAVSPLLQIRRMLATRSSADVSIGYLAVLVVGFALWIAYGVSLPNWALIVPNSVAFAFGIGTILIALRLRPAAS